MNIKQLNNWKLLKKYCNERPEPYNILNEFFWKGMHWVKRVRIRNYSGLHSAAFGLNTEKAFPVIKLIITSLKV